MESWSFKGVCQGAESRAEVVSPGRSPADEGRKLSLGPKQQSWRWKRKILEITI